MCECVMDIDDSAQVRAHAHTNREAEMFGLQQVLEIISMNSNEREMFGLH